MSKTNCTNLISHMSYPVGQVQCSSILTLLRTKLFCFIESNGTIKNEACSLEFKNLKNFILLDFKILYLNNQYPHKNSKTSALCRKNLFLTTIKTTKEVINRLRPQQKNGNSIVSEEKDSNDPARKVLLQLKRY